MTVSATRRNYDVVLATPDGTWHTYCVPATNVARASNKAIRCVQEKYGFVEDENGKEVATIARTDIAVFSCSPEMKSNGVDINWPKIRVREGFELPQPVVDQHEFEVVAEEE